MLFRKIFFILLLLFQFNYAKECVIDDSENLIDCNENITYFVDSRGLFFYRLLPPFEYFTLKDKLLLGHVAHPVWSKLQIHYSGEKPQTLIFYNPKVLTDKLKVFIFKNGKLFQRDTLGDMVDPKNKNISSRYSAFELTLEPNQNYQIITQIEHKGGFDIRWNIKKRFDFDTFVTQESIIIALFLGLLIAIAFYTLLLYKATKDTIYLFYSLHIFFMFLYQIANTNILYQFGIMLGGYFIWIVAFLSFAALLLFGRVFINPKESHPWIERYLKVAIVLFLGSALYFFLASYANDLMIFRKMIVWSAIVLIITSIVILSFVAYKKEIQGQNTTS